MKTQFSFLSVSTALVGSAGLLSPAVAGVVILNPIQDASLYQDTNGAQSSGASTFLMTGSVGAGDTTPLRRGLLQFNLASIPAGAVVTGVSLTLNLMRLKNTQAALTTLQRVTSSWVEGSTNAGTGGNGATANTGDATWLHRSKPQAWSTPGGDFLGTTSASLTVTGLGLYTWTGAGLVTDVQAWLAQPAQNFGWMLRGDEARSQSVKEFSSRTGTVPPSLRIEFTEVPEPGTVGLLGGVLLWSGRRRRHN